ncbi:MAG: hypothetical protein R3E67_09270 [Pseudomonadales bacterium]
MRGVVTATGIAEFSYCVSRRGGSILLAMAVLDDKQGLHPLIRLVAQVVAAALLVWGTRVCQRTVANRAVASVGYCGVDVVH